MSEIIESIKQGASQVWSELDEKGQLKSTLSGIRKQWSELERRRKTNALKGEIKSLRSETKQLTEALGLQALTLIDAGKIVHPELSRLAERINELRSEADQRKAELIKLLGDIKPGITEIIVHCTVQTPVFSQISGSGPTREAELRLLTDDDIKEFIKSEGIVLTTWRELKERRDLVKN